MSHLNSLSLSLTLFTKKKHARAAILHWPVHSAASKSNLPDLECREVARGEGTCHLAFFVVIFATAYESRQIAKCSKCLKHAHKHIKTQELPNHWLDHDTAAFGQLPSCDPQMPELNATLMLTTRSPANLTPN